MLKNKTNKVFHGMLFGTFLLAGCQAEDLYNPETDTPIETKFQEEWVKNVGEIDPEQTWKTTRICKLNVNIDKEGAYVLKVYNKNPQVNPDEPKAHLLAKFQMNGNSASTFIVDVPLSLTTCYVTLISDSENITAPVEIMDDQMDFSLTQEKSDQYAAKISRVITRDHDDDDEDEDDDDEDYLVICEDLGSVGDRDFNDVVLDLDYENGDDELKITPLAAGGTLPAYIYYKETEIGEIHSLMGATSTSTTINAYQKGKEGKEIKIELNEEKSIEDIMNNLHIKVQHGENNFIDIEFPNKGEAPHMLYINMDDDWLWAREGVCIEDAYPEFKEWNANHSSRTDWYKHGSKNKDLFVKDK